VLKKFLLLGLFLTFSFSAEVKQRSFKLSTIEGKDIVIEGTKNGINIPEYKGKVIFLEFWGTHCPPCLYSIPRYVELTKKYKDKVAMLAIEVQGTPKEQLKAFVKEKGINYNIFTQSDNRKFRIQTK